MWVCETFSLMKTCQNLFLKVNDETILAVELHVFRGLQLKKPENIKALTQFETVPTRS